MLSNDQNSPLETIQLLFTQQEELDKPIKFRNTITHRACNALDELFHANA